MKTLGISASALVMALVTPAIAQEAANSARPDNAGAAGAGEIVVTARKRAETIMDVPTAVSALTADDIATRGIVDFSGLNQFVPGFRWNATGSSNTARTFNTFVMRGTYAGSDHPDRQNVSLFIDGIPIGGAGALPGLTDTRQVEVVKGPQSAYFGRSTFGGAVNFITAAPGNDFTGSVRADMSTYEGREISGTIDIPVVQDLLAIRLSARHYHTGGQYKNFGYGGKLGERETNSYSTAINFTPAHNFSVRGYYTAWKDRDGPAATALLTSDDYNCDAGAGAGSLNYFCGPIRRAPANRMSQNITIDPAEVNRLSEANRVLGDGFLDDFGFRRKAWFGYLSAQYDFENDWSLVVNGGASHNRYGVISDNANRYITDGRYSVTSTPWDVETRSAEVRLSSDPRKPLKLVLGTNYFRQISHAGSSSIRTGGAMVTGLPYQRGAANTYGLFASVTYDISDALNVSAEGRYQVDKIRSTVLLPGGVDAHGRTKSFTPRVIAQYKLSPSANIYASYSEGTRPAQFNTSVYSLSSDAQQQLAEQAGYIPLMVSEERLKMGEFGFKGSFLNNRLRFMSALYYGKWSGKQIQQSLQYRPTPDTLTPLLVFLPNGKVNVYGIEVEANFDLTSDVSLNGTFGYAETDLKNTSCTECLRITGDGNPVGNRLPRYPAYTAAAAIDYHPDLGNGWTGLARADWVYTGRQYETEANVAWLPSSQIVNLRLGLQRDDFSFEVYVRNLFNDDTPLNIGRAQDTFNSSNTLVLAPALKRVVGIVTRIGF